MQSATDGDRLVFTTSASQPVYFRVPGVGDNLR